MWKDRQTDRHVYRVIPMYTIITNFIYGWGLGYKNTCGNKQFTTCVPFKQCFCFKKKNW